MQISSPNLCCAAASLMCWQNCTPPSPKIFPWVVIHSVMEIYWGNNLGEVCWGWKPGEEEGRGVRGGEGVKGVCAWRLIGKNADKPAPRMLLAWKPFLFVLVIGYHDRSEPKRKGMWRVLLGCLWKEAFTCCLYNIDTCFKLINLKISRGIPPLLLNDDYNSRLLLPCMFLPFMPLKLDSFWGCDVHLAWLTPFCRHLTIWGGKFEKFKPKSSLLGPAFLWEKSFCLPASSIFSLDSDIFLFLVGMGT